MRMGVAHTSRAAFGALRAEGKLAPQEQRVIQAIRDHGPLTREEISERTGLRLSAVCGRVNKLVELGTLDERGTRLNPQTRKSCKLVCMRAVQGSLFQ